MLAGLPKGAYRCPLIVDVINTDIIWDTTDATDCIREGRYHFLGYNDDVDFNDDFVELITLEIKTK